MAKKPQKSVEAYRTEILSQCRDAGRNGIKRPSLRSVPFREALQSLLNSGELVERISGKARLLFLRTALPTFDDLVTGLREDAVIYGREGLKSKHLAAYGWASQEDLQRALSQLEREGELVAVRHKRSVIYYRPEFAPPLKPTPRELALKALEELTARGEAWVETALVGVGKGQLALEKRALLEEWTRRGKLVQFTIVLGNGTTAVAYRLPDRRTVPQMPMDEIAEVPDWPEIERAARELARRSVDGTVSFEEVAEFLRTTPLVVKTAVMQQIELEGPVQLVRGESRDVRHPATAGLEFRGARYYRFGFID